MAPKMLKPQKKRVQGTYGKSWENLLSYKLDKKWLQKIGRVIVEEVVQQARVDAAKARGLKVGNMIPLEPEFYKSFGYRILGESTIEVTSSWPWITDLTDGRGPFPMTWLMSKVGGVRKIIPLAVPGQSTPIFRTLPLETEKAWIHPGIARHTFVQKGIKRARKRIYEVYAEALKEQGAKGA